MNRTSSPIRRSAAVLALLLAGCTVGPNFERPAPPKTQSYAMAGDEAVQTASGEKIAGDWWSLFHSPELDAVVRQAVAGNRTLAQARATLEQSKEAVAAESGLFAADMSGGIKRQHANLSAFGLPAATFGLSNPTFNLYSVGATVAYNLDPFGGSRRRMEVLGADAEVRAHEVDAAYLTLTGQVVNQALSIAAARARIAAAQDIVASDRANLDMIRRAKDAGGATGFDVAAVESRMAADSADIPAMRQQLATARHALAVLVGQAPADWRPPDFDLDKLALPAALPLSLPSEMARNRPDILAAEARLHAATAQIGVETANLYPKLTLSAALNQDALSPEKIFSYDFSSWSVAAGVTAPLFHGGELKARKREAVDAAKAAAAAYEETVLQALGQVADVLQAIAHDRDTITERTRAMDAAAATRRLAQISERGGEGPALKVLEAERAWREARLDLVEAQAHVYADVAQLYLALGAVPPQA